MASEVNTENVNTADVEEVNTPETQKEPPLEENWVLKPEQEAQDSTPQSADHKDNIHYEDGVAVFTDPESKYQYTWSTEKEEWVLRDSRTYGFEDDTHTYTDSDGVKYFWDTQKNAWFPKLDDEFMAMYQLNYGFVQNEQAPPKADEVITKEVEKKTREGRASTQT
uniref:Uncharacterized protein n=1 Tax=Photinus pyralis TaxID=7054 RepID=A0A1Y1KVP4_PHOPY